MALPHATAQQPTRNTDSSQAVRAAIRANDVPLLRILLDEWRNDPHAVPNHGPERQPMLPFQASLQEAARNGQPDVVDALISQGCEIDTDTVVAATGKIPVFGVLLKHGYDINLCLGHVGDALILAICSDNTPFISFLLDHGADPNANTRNDLYTPLECAAPSASLATIQLLISHGAKLSSRRVLCRAAMYGRVDVARFLLDNGAAVDEIPDNENIYDNEREQGVGTALHAAVEAGELETAQLLLERGARTDLKDSNGLTVMEIAKLRGQTECVELLTRY